MVIKRLNLVNFRNYSKVNLELVPSMNIFIGENDSGKSSILEAIQIATRGRLGRTYSTQCTTGNQNT